MPLAVAAAVDTFNCSFKGAGLVTNTITSIARITNNTANNTERASGTEAAEGDPKVCGAFPLFGAIQNCQKVT